MGMGAVHMPVVVMVVVVRMIMIVVMVMVVVVMGVVMLVGVMSVMRVAGRAQAKHTLLQEQHAHANHDDPGDDAQPGVELLRQNILRRVQGDQAERKNAQGMGGRHGEAQKERMTRRSSRTHQICRHNCFAMAR